MAEILGEPVGYNLHANVAKFDSNVVKGWGIFGDVSTENKYTTRTAWWRKGAWEVLVARRFIRSLGTLGRSPVGRCCPESTLFGLLNTLFSLLGCTMTHCHMHLNFLHQTAWFILAQQLSCLLTCSLMGGDARRNAHVFDAHVTTKFDPIQCKSTRMVFAIQAAVTHSHGVTLKRPNRA